MKILLPIFIILISCGNPKEEIVNRQIVLKDSIDYFDRKIKARQLEIKGSLPMVNDADFGFFDDKKLIEYGRKKDSVNRLAEYFALSPEGKILFNSRKQYQKEYDSLEMELKKY